MEDPPKTRAMPPTQPSYPSNEMAIKRAQMWLPEEWDDERDQGARVGRGRPSCFDTMMATIRSNINVYYIYIYIYCYLAEGTRGD